MRPYWKETVVVAPRGLTEPFSVAEELATFVARLVVTTGVGVGVDTGVAVAVAAGVGVGVGVGVGEGAAFVTTTIPTILQHAPCGVQ